MSHETYHENNTPRSEDGALDGNNPNTATSTRSNYIDYTQVIRNNTRSNLAYEEMINAKPLFPDARQDEYKNSKVWEGVAVRNEQRPPWINTANGSVATSSTNSRRYYGRLSPMQTVDGLELISRSFANGSVKNSSVGSMSRGSITNTTGRYRTRSQSSHVSTSSIGTATEEEREEYSLARSQSCDTYGSNSTHTTTHTPYNNPTITSTPSKTASITTTTTQIKLKNNRHKWKKQLASAFREILHEMEQLYAMRSAATDENDIAFWDGQIASLKECALQLCDDPDDDTSITSETIISLIAPADLPGGHSYVTSYKGRSIVATVPTEGITKGEKFHTNIVPIPEPKKKQPKSIQYSSSSTSNTTNYSSSTNISNSPYVKVRAPASLPAGSRFNARCGKKTIVATVPPGGVVKGEVFSVLLLPPS